MTERTARLSKRSGFLSLRITKTLHQLIADAAKREGVSINQYIATCLAMSVEPPDHQFRCNLHRLIRLCTITERDRPQPKTWPNSRAGKSSEIPCFVCHRLDCHDDHPIKFSRGDVD